MKKLRSKSMTMGNDLSDIETFAKHLGIEINMIDAEQFNSIVYTETKVPKTRSIYLKIEITLT